MIYHITTEPEWELQAGNNYYEPKRFEEEGFIHCSTKTQVQHTANRIFNSYKTILLLCIDDEKEKSFIKYENLEGGKELYPHIYRKLPKENILKVLKILKAADDSFIIPETI
jgi:uncharacterized protein (DUF952 family)